MEIEDLIEYLMKRKVELEAELKQAAQQAAERAAMPYRAAIGEVEHTLEMIQAEPINSPRE